jgi:ubiquinone biosynthesis protein
MILPFENRVSRKPDEVPRDVAVTVGALPQSPVPEPEPGTREWRAHLRRRERIQNAAGFAVDRWQRLTNQEPDPAPVFTELPRPKGLHVEKRRDRALPPRRTEENFAPSFVHTLLRLALWIFAGLRFLVGTATDLILDRDTEERRAVRLRLIFESLGTTFIKLGQQLSMRLDLLPYAYTRELESMLDRVPPIDEDVAIDAIEKATGKKLDEIFLFFDRKPIGSASVACVYQAVLRTGERVAVKVRRPGIGEKLSADMRALQWVLRWAEYYLMPPGFADNFMFELRSMLLEELDFVREARFTSLFRRKMRKTKQLHFATSPRVFLEYSTANLLVTEFMNGVWMNDVITAYETQDREAIKQLQEMNIDPVILARRVQLVARFNNFENIFFHADIHPANLLVQPGNRIVLIDFGSCGSFSRKELNSWRRWFDAQSVNDVGGMVQAALGIIEPVPPIDKDEFALKLETMFWNDLYAIKDKHSHWSERISARLWLGFLKISREYQVPMRLNTLRMIRASMLADTIAARLDNDQDPYREFRYYAKGAGRRARKRVFKRVETLSGPGKWIRMENGIESGLKLMYQMQRAVDSLQSIGLIPLIGKGATFIILFIRFTVKIGLLTALFAGWYWAKYGLRIGPAFMEDLLRIVTDTATNPFYHAILLFNTVIAVHGLRSRLNARD